MMDQLFLSAFRTTVLLILWTLGGAALSFPISIAMGLSIAEWCRILAYAVCLVVVWVACGLVAIAAGVIHATFKEDPTP